MTLWKHTAALSGPRARRQLLELSNRALIRSGPNRVFSLHDLLHDYVRVVVPDLCAAHGQLLDAYPSPLPDDGYIHGHLIWHMENAGRVAQMHNLLCEETATGRNLWAETRERLGQLTGYRKDLAHVSAMAGLSVKSALAIGQPAAAVGLEVRNALIAASLASRARVILPNLLGRLVETGVWTVSQALDSAQQAGPENRFAALARMGPVIPEPVWRDLVKVAWGTPEAFFQIAGLAVSDRTCRTAFCVKRSTRS